MPDQTPARRLGQQSSAASPYGQQGSSANLADILERVLDKGIVIAGDIQINLLDIELLTIKLRLLVASVDKAKEMGIDWWEHDPSLSSRAHDSPVQMPARSDSRARDTLAEENEQLRRELDELRSALPAASQQDEEPEEAELVEDEDENEDAPQPEPQPEPAPAPARKRATARSGEAPRKKAPARKETAKRPAQDKEQRGGDRGTREDGRS